MIIKKNYICETDEFAIESARKKANFLCYNTHSVYEISILLENKKTIKIKSLPQLKTFEKIIDQWEESKINYMTAKTNIEIIEGRIK